MKLKLTQFIFITILISSCSNNSGIDVNLRKADSTKTESKPSINFIELFKDTTFEDFHFYIMNNPNIFNRADRDKYITDSMPEFSTTHFHNGYYIRPVYPKYKFKISDNITGLIFCIPAGFNMEYSYALGIYKDGKVTDLYIVAEEWGDGGIVDNIEGWLTENKTKLIVRKHYSDAHIMDGALDSLTKGFATHIDHYDSSWTYIFKNDSYLEIINAKVDKSVYKFHNAIFMDSIMKPD